MPDRLPKETKSGENCRRAAAWTWNPVLTAFRSEFFSSEPAIFIPEASSEGVHVGEWKPLNQCFWDGLSCLRKACLLKPHYPALGEFFCRTLRLADACDDALLFELREVGPYDSLLYVKDLFIATSGLVKQRSRSTLERILKPLVKLPVFPVDTTLKAQEGHFDCLKQALHEDIWFIADRPHLRRCFEGHIPLLAFSIEAITQMLDLLRFLKVDSRMLSSVASGLPQVEGDTEIAQEYTEKLRRKAHLILR
jgi:hypothetical protein